MFSNSFMSLRRFSGFALTFLLLAAGLCVGAWAQTAPTAIASFATVLAQPQGASIGSIANSTTDTFGDWLVEDDSTGALYEFPAGGGASVTLVGAEGLTGSNSSSAIVTPGIAVDPSNNLYIEGGSCVLVYPYDSSTKTWDGLSAITQNTTSSSACGTASPTFYNLGTGVQTWGIGIGNTSAPGLLVGTSQSGSSSANGIVGISVSGTWAAPVAGTATSIISGLQGPAISIAEDPAGNIYFVEEGGLPGVYEIPAGQTGLTSDSGLTRVDPDLLSVTGVTVDSAGNLYISDGPSGVYILPKGSSSSSAAFVLTSVPAQGSIGVPGNSGNLFVPSSSGTGATAATTADEVTFNAAAFGAVNVGATKAAQGDVYFSFNTSTTLSKIQILEASASNPGFTIVNGGSLDCATNATHSPTASQNCIVAINFMPNAVGSVSAVLDLLGKSGAVVASVPLEGVGVGGAVQFQQAAQSTIGGSLMTPSQMAVDGAGNIYVADPGLGAVEMFPAGSAKGTAGTPVGTGLKAPTGVAVDGAGDVFIADSGSIYEVPETATGLSAKSQVTLNTGLTLGTHVQLAADGFGDLFVSDADNKSVYELENFSEGWNASLPGVLSSKIVTITGAAVSAPTAIAVDSNDNLYVDDGGNLYKVTPSGTQTQVLTGLSGVTGLAVDPSGSVYVAMTNGTIRVPNESGTLNIADKTAVAGGVTSPASVALDSLGNIYVADGSALNVNMTSASASIDFGTLTSDPYPAPSSGSSATKTATLVNDGNAPLAVTGYANTADFSETADTCSGNSIAIDSTCTVTVTFSAGIGDGGSLSGEVLVQGNVGNSPVGVNGTGVAPTLAGSTTVMTVATNGTIEGLPVTVTVTPNGTSTQQLTGTVTLTVIPGNDVPVTNPALLNPYTITSPLIPAASGNGATVQFDPSALPIGSYALTATYNGDTTYIYEHSSDSESASVATSVPVAMTQPAASAITWETYTLPCTSGTGSSCATSYNYGQPADNAPGYLVLAGEGCESCGGAQPYDGSASQWEYTYPVSVAEAASGYSMIATAAYGPTPTPTPVQTEWSNPATETGWDYGSVNYLMANGHSLCGDSSGSPSIINVSSTGDASLALDCATINTSNNTIPDLMTFYTVTPVYTGGYNDLVNDNPNYSKNTGSSFNIWAMRNPVVQISSSPATLTVAPGSAANATLTLTSVLGYGYAGRNAAQNNWSLPLDLECQGLPAYATCTFTYPTPNAADPNMVQGGYYNPAGLLCAGSTSTYCAVDVGPLPGAAIAYATPSGGPLPSGATAATYPCGPADGCLGPGTVLVTINTNVSPGITSSQEISNSSFRLAALFGLGFLGFAFRRRASRLGAVLMVVCLLLCGGAITGMTACSTTNLGVTNGAVTPAGNYWITVVAKETGSMLVQSPYPPKPGTPPTWTTVYGNGNLASLPFTVNLTVN